MDKENTICSKDTLSRNLLELTAISGEFPQKDLHRIAGGKSYKESVVGTLKREGLIKTYYRDSLRGLRLTCRAKRLRAILMSDLKERDSGQIIENDASEQDGTPVLFRYYLL